MTARVELLTKRFLLRELTVEDATPRYLSWLSDADARRFIVAAATTSELADLRRYVSERSGRQDVLFLGIFSRADGLHIGNIKYEPLDPVAGYAIMGILIGDPAFRSQGVTPEVVSASASWLRDNRAITQILLGVGNDNHAAIRAYEKIGFVRTDSPYLRPAHEAMAMVWPVPPNSTATRA